MQQRWDDSLNLLQTRGQYVDWDRWHTQPAIARLADSAGPAWIVKATEAEAPRAIPVPVARLRPSMQRFAALPLKETPYESWQLLMRELTAP